MRSRATSVLLAAVVVGSLGGCTFTAPQTNQLAYDPSDGVSGSTGAIELRNALLITDDDTTSANFVVSMVNTGVQNVTLRVSWEGASGRVERNVYIPQNSVKSFGAENDQIVLGDIDAEPGSLFPVYVQYGDHEGEEIRVPVLDGTLPEYEDLLPAS